MHIIYIYLYRVKPGELVSGKKVCEKMFQHAIAKITIPARTREQQQRVVGTLYNHSTLYILLFTYMYTHIVYVH